MSFLDLISKISYANVHAFSLLTCQPDAHNSVDSGALEQVFSTIDQIILPVGSVLCIEGCLIVPLASTNQMTTVPASSFDNQKYLQVWPSVCLRPSAQEEKAVAVWVPE